MFAVYIQPGVVVCARAAVDAVAASIRDAAETKRETVGMVVLRWQVGRARTARISRYGAPPRIALADDRPWDHNLRGLLERPTDEQIHVNVRRVISGLRIL